MAVVRLLTGGMFCLLPLNRLAARLTSWGWLLILAICCWRRISTRHRLLACLVVPAHPN
ncbi:MAG TPA: hypothetical protein DEQ51_02260 [Alphaproteobacteria bacterium]|nr:hypothetical protein [Alphaproteobacteria bacterium]